MRIALLMLVAALPACLPRKQAPDAPDMSGEPDTPRVPEATSTLEVTYLANEGFLLRAGDDSVLIDAFVAEPYSIYAALAPEARANLVRADPPFDDVDVALVSHRHGDHFQPTTACKFLAAAPECVLATSPEVVGLLKDCGGLFAERVHEVLPDPGEVEVLEVGDIRIEFLRLSHGTGRFESIQNLGHVITIGGQRVLHIGDAEMNLDNFAPYAPALRDLDVALVPYWYFAFGPGRDIVEERFHARETIAVHVPPRDFDATADTLALDFPLVFLFERRMQSFRFRAPEARED